MVSIDVSEFANKVQEYHINTDRPESWFFPQLPDDLFDGTVESCLRIHFEKGAEWRPWPSRTGIRFGHNTRLVMQLLERAYQELTVDVEDYSQAVAEAMQNFARPFSEDDDNLCYPHFLLHGIVQPTLEGVVDRINTNSRIIHETLELREEIIRSYGRIILEGDLQLAMSSGCTDDYFGIAYLFAMQDAILLSSATSYLTKASFFVDQTEGEVYVITLQGRRFGPHDPIRAASGQEKRLANEREYSRIGNIIGMGPRRFVLTKLKELSEELGYKRIRVVRPEEHPMFIEKHEGFKGNYENVIRKAGITEENGCYLESVLGGGELSLAGGGELSLTEDE